MVTTVLLALFGVGLAVGFLSGLIGIGGGVLIVPFLYFFYAHPGWSRVAVSPALEAAVAHATSLFIIVPTAIRGTISFHRAGLVVWRAVLPIAVASIVGAIAGARIALILPAEVLRITFALLLIFTGTQMGQGGAVERARPRRITLLRTGVTGVLIGILSALLGVGGGLIAIPMLVYVVGLELHQVAATSLAIVAFAATAGMATYAVSGWETDAAPPGSLGYIHLVAALPMLAGSLLSVQWGTRANQRLPVRRLRIVFALLFVGLGIELLIENLLALV